MGIGNNMTRVDAKDKVTGAARGCENRHMLRCDGYPIPNGGSSMVRGDGSSGYTGQKASQHQGKGLRR